MLQELVDWIFFSLLHLNAQSFVVSTLHFFLYDFIKLIFLLFILIAIIGVLRTYLSPSRIKQLLAKPKASNYVVASFFGAITPFCSCSSVPIFISFMEAGVPSGVLFTFLITSPLINEFVAVLMLGLFGWKITLVYIASGIIIGIIAGAIIGRFTKKHHLVRSLSKNSLDEQTYNTFSQRIAYGVSEAKDITKKLWLYIAIGIGVGAIIHNYVPQEFIIHLMESLGVFGVPAAVLLGVPMYGNGVAIVPIATELFAKGVPLGTALAFMMSMVGLSFPEAIILRRVMRLELIGIFFGVVALGIILIGFSINLLAPFLL